jgi:hypothetical protein
MKKALSLLSLTFLLSLHAEAQKNNSLLWEVKSSNGKTSYLFGTYHLIGSEYLKTHKKVAEAYAKSNTVVVETVIDSSQMMQMAMVGMMPDKSLKSMVDSADYAMLKKEIMRVTGYDIAMFDQMKPMTISAMYAAALAEDELDGEGLSGNPIDVYFASYGKRNGKEVIELETMMEQAEMLYNGTTPEEQAAVLVQSVKDSLKSSEVTEDLLEAYMAEDLDLMWKMSNEEEDPLMDMTLLLDNRNTAWIEKLKPVLNAGSAFIAVGALHLPGDVGVIELLKKEGYSIKPVK